MHKRNASRARRLFCPATQIGTHLTHNRDDKCLAPHAQCGSNGPYRGAWEGDCHAGLCTSATHRGRDGFSAPPPRLGHISHTTGTTSVWRRMHNAAPTVHTVGRGRGTVMRGYAQAQRIAGETAFLMISLACVQLAHPYLLRHKLQNSLPAE